MQITHRSVSEINIYTFAEKRQFTVTWDHDGSHGDWYFELKNKVDEKCGIQTKNRRF